MEQSDCWVVDKGRQSSERFASTPFAHAIKIEVDEDGAVLFCENKYGLGGGQTL
jgi:hypothetical protein